MSDIDFSGDEAQRFLPWLIGIMVALATALLCLAITINGWVIDRHGSYADSFTVNIPASTEKLSERGEALTTALKALPYTREVTRLSDADVRDMLKPWLGSAGTLDSLPLPAVFDVALKKDATPPDYAALQKQLAEIAPGVEVDAHEQWVAAFAGFSAAAQWLTGIFALLIVGACAAMVAFAARASLKLHSRSVHLLHSIGAEDDYVARLFQREALRMVIPGAVGGTVVAGLLYWAAGMYMLALDTAVLPSLAMTRAHFFLLLLTPPACVAGAWAMARVSVLRQLKTVL